MSRGRSDTLRRSAWFLVGSEQALPSHQNYDMRAHYENQPSKAAEASSMVSIATIEKRAFNDNRAGASAPEMSLEEFWEDGVLHRADGPAVVRVDTASGTIVYEEYWQHGTRHRDSGPAILRRHAATGRIMVEKYYVAGQLHRSHGPAFFRQNPLTGVIANQEHWVEGRQHRLGGPAVVTRCIFTGILVHTGYWIDDRPYSRAAFMALHRSRFKVLTNRRDER